MVYRLALYCETGSVVGHEALALGGTNWTGIRGAYQGEIRSLTFPAEVCLAALAELTFATFWRGRSLGMAKPVSLDDYAPAVYRGMTWSPCVNC